MRKIIKQSLCICIVILSMTGMFFILKYINSDFGTNRTVSFVGAGTEKNPYIIEGKDSLKELCNLVNSGESFEGIYFQQTADIDLENEEWMPIGIYQSGKYFCGIYDGGGYCIKNILITDAYPYKPANVGLFGMLGGTVRNLGIESGSISGDYVGAIASHASGENALIFNCYNNASVSGTGRAGGICDNINGGSVLNCANTGKIAAPISSEIVSYQAGLVSAIYPNTGVLPFTFSGEYIDIKLSGEDVKDILNSGLDMLVDTQIVDRKDVTWWR